MELAAWLLLLVSLACALWLARRGAAERPATEPSREPLSLVPPGARLLVSVDVASLTRVAGPELLRLGGDKLLGLRDTCGFEPLLSVQRAVLAMPAGDAGERASDFALIAATSLDVEQGLRCAERVIAKRGGKPARSRLGAFTSVRDASKPSGEVALRSDGMFVLSGGRYFRDVMDAASAPPSADEAATLRTQLHHSLRRKLGAAELQLTLLPEAASPLRGVMALGLAVRLGSDLSLRGVVACVSPAACAAAQELADGARRELSREPGLSGLSNVRIQQAGDRLELSGRLPREQLVPLLAQLLAP